MKKFILCIIFFVTLCVSILYFAENNGNQIIDNDTCKNYIEENVNSNEKNYEEENSKPCLINKENCNKNTLYELKEYEGNIAIFKSNEKSPYKITSILIKELPEKDREILKKGIKVSSENELNTLLEDYCS